GGLSGHHRRGRNDVEGGVIGSSHPGPRAVGSGRRRGRHPPAAAQDDQGSRREQHLEAIEFHAPPPLVGAARKDSGQREEPGWARARGCWRASPAKENRPVTRIWSSRLLQNWSIPADRLTRDPPAEEGRGTGMRSWQHTVVLDASRSEPLFLQ